MTDEEKIASGQYYAVLDPDSFTPKWVKKTMQLNVSKIIWIEGDDGSMTKFELLKQSGLSQSEIFNATLIITDRGKVLKNRLGLFDNDDNVDSFDLVKESASLLSRAECLRMLGNE